MLAQPTSAIPPPLRDEVERETHSVIGREAARGGGGASRQGAEIVLCASDGTERHCYLAWDARAGDVSRLAYFERETAILTALSTAFRNAGIKVAPLIAAFPSHLAMLSGYVRGEANFGRAAEKGVLARRFVEQLALLHTLDARHPAFAPLGDAAVPPSVRIQANIAAWRALNLGAGPDPVFQLALAWLADNVPPDRGPAAVLHGDAGPGNFLFEGANLTALVDWELTHLGDPMEDLAQIWVRSLIQPFVPMRDVFAVYEQSTGTPVDVQRVKFFRLYFQLSFSVPGAALAAASGSAVGATGTALLYGTMHRRVIVRSLAELAGCPVRAPHLPDLPAASDDRLFATALVDLRDDIVPAIGSERAAVKAKELARLVKFWRRRATYGAAYDAAELADIRGVLPGAAADLAGARADLARAIADGAVGFAAALQVCHNRTVRETAIMADGMGALATRWYEDGD